MTIDHPSRGFGAMAGAGELIRFLERVLADNNRLEAAGLPKMPVCIWGKHGIGKTQIVRDLAARRGFGLAYLAPAQVEEMGDLLGMPSISPQGTTVFRPPDWAPAQAGPGILLIDDINRADDRILRGIMQLLQDHALMSWALPPGWHIVLTANPDDGNYSVTPLDDAMLSRMMHVTLQFDLREWVCWALDAGVDERGINFVLAYPEAITGRRTTARTLTRFFHAIAPIPDLSAEAGLVRLLAAASLDTETVQSFMHFIELGRRVLPSPDEVLSASDFTGEIERPLYDIAKGPPLRTDLLSAVCTRMAVHLLRPQAVLAGPEQKNLKSFFLMGFLPPELRFSLARDLAVSKSPGVQAVLNDPELAPLLL